MEKQLDLSIIIPVYNEEESLYPLYKKIKAVLSKSGKSYEIMFIDDGSSDTSLENLKSLQKNDKGIKIIIFRKNFGQSAAISAGFSNARGEILVVMDADLQNEPNDILRLLKKIDEGYDVVSGWRYDREDPLSKKLPSRISNWMHKRLTGLNINDSGCSLKAYKRESVSDLELYGEMHRYIPALIAAKGFKIGEIKVEHHYRKFGKSKYGGVRLLKGFLDLLYIHFLTKYSSRPLHFFGGIGLGLVFLGIILGIWRSTVLYIERIIHKLNTPFGSLLLLAIFLIIIGILFITFGFLAELMIRIHYQSAKNKNYSIKEII